MTAEEIPLLLGVLREEREIRPGSPDSFAFDDPPPVLVTFSDSRGLALGMAEAFGKLTPEEALRVTGVELRDYRGQESYGPYRLSIQAANTMRCLPRMDGLKLTEYRALEVGILLENDCLCKPSETGIPELAPLDRYFDDRGPGSYVPTPLVLLLKKKLYETYVLKKDEEVKDPNDSPEATP